MMMLATLTRSKFLHHFRCVRQRMGDPELRAALLQEAAAEIPIIRSLLKLAQHEARPCSRVRREVRANAKRDLLLLLALRDLVWATRATSQSMSALDRKT